MSENGNIKHSGISKIEGRMKVTPTSYTLLSVLKVATNYQYPTLYNF